ncbi:MAG: hypothetical protein R3E96_06970 [Planctomycetota bacterium]
MPPPSPRRPSRWIWLLWTLLFLALFASVAGPIWWTAFHGGPLEEPAE